MKQRMVSLALCGLVLLAGCQRSAVQEEIWELEQEDVVTFADGETADRWRGYQNGLRETWSVYELSDGTTILLEDDLAGPENDAGYSTLSEEVQAAVCAWYQGEGKRYDLPALLQASYDRYQEQGKDQFEAGRVTQSIGCTGSSEQIIYFTTTVDQAVDPAQGVSFRYSAIFDRESGQRLELWSLFTQSESSVRMALASAAGDDPAIQERLAAAINPEQVIFFGDHLEIDFPAGAFEGLNVPYTLAVDYAQLDGLLDSRALPAED